MVNEIRSGQYKPSEEWCCEKCVFGTGDHEYWCQQYDHYREVGMEVFGYHDRN
jgi:hypothetical protein